MIRNLLIPFICMAALPASAQLGIGGIIPMHPSAMGGDRGTDTLFTFGVEQASAAGQIAGYVTPGGGMLFGPSEYPTSQFAQEFELIDGPANVDGIVFLWAQRVYASNDPASHVKARLWRMDGMGGLISTGTGPRPNTVLREVQLPIAQTAAGVVAGVSFPPQWLNGKFAAGFALAGLNPADSVNLAATTNGYVEMPDRSWINLSGAWATVLLATGQPGQPGTGQNIDFVVGAVLTPSSASVGEAAWLNGMQLDVLGGNPVRGEVILRYALREPADVRLWIIDAMGRTMVDEQLGRQSGEHLRTLSTSGWAAGTYYVNVLANGRPITKRLVVED